MSSKEEVAVNKTTHSKRSGSTMNSKEEVAVKKTTHSKRSSSTMLGNLRMQEAIGLTTEHNLYLQISKKSSE